MPYALTYDEVKSLGPCSYAFRRASKLLGGKKGWNGRKIDAATAREAGCTLTDILWVTAAVAKNDPDVERRLRLWVADCAAHVLHIYEQSETSDAPRKAIIAARQYARGEIDDAAMNAAWGAASAAASASASAAADVAKMNAAWGSAMAATWSAAVDVTRYAEWAAEWASDWAAAMSAMWGAAGEIAGDAEWASDWAAAMAVTRRAASDAEKEWQFARLIERLSDNEPEDWPMPLRRSLPKHKKS